ncbi:MAG: DUF1573 domain-containing protein [Muribaculaceae bacterium]|nr:DUF1573 domain-containing protein [Muribaculaceae bacterium]
MKYIRLMAVLGVAILAIGAAARTPGQKVGVTFSELCYDFGTVATDAEPVVHTFTVTNNGSEAVAILSARASCGCTEPTYQRRPIMPGETGQVTVRFIPQGQRGEVDKNVTLRLKAADGKSEKVHLRLVGTVVPPAR